MEFIIGFFTAISALGKTLMIPMMITIIALIIRVPFSKALKSGITVGIGLTGLTLTMSLVTTYVGPIINVMVEKFGLKLTYVDVGWTAVSGIAYSTVVGAFIIPFTLLINVIVLALKGTKTLNIDIWNYWKYALAGSLVYLLTDSLVASFLAATVYIVACLVIADRTAELVQEFFGIPGISIPQGSAAGSVLICLLLEKVFNIFSSIFSRIFSRNKEKESVDWAAKINNNKVLQTINDPIYVGLAIGTFLALLGGYNLKGALEVGMYMAALMFILPRMASILMEGLTPISAAAKEFMGKKYKGQQFYIGMDSAIIIGHPTTLAVGLLSIPILLVLALLPGNKLIPMAGLATLAYFGVMATPIHKGKFFRTLVSQTVILTFCMYLGSYFAPLITEHALNAGTAVPEGAGGITSMSANVFEFLTYFLFKLGTIPGACISIAIVAVLIIWNRKYIAGKDNFTTQEFVSAEASDYKK